VKGKLKTESQLLKEFPTRNWSCSGLNHFLQKKYKFCSAGRRVGSGRRQLDQQSLLPPFIIGVVISQHELRPVVHILKTSLT